MCFLSIVSITANINLDDLESSQFNWRGKKPETSIYFDDNNNNKNNNIQENENAEEFRTPLVGLLILTLIVFLLFINWYLKSKGIGRASRNRRQNYLLNKLGF